MGLNTFSAGVNTNFSSELNDNFRGNKVLEIYSSTGFDTSVSSNDTETSSVELTAVDSSTISGATYLEIAITGTGAVFPSDGDSATVSVKIEVKETGESYSTVYNGTFLFGDVSTGESMRVTASKTLSILHTLTAGEKSNGFQVQLSSTSTTQTSAGSASFTHTQTIIKTGV